MSNNLIIMSKARSILKMYTEGVSKQSISIRTGATRNTVKKYIRQFIAMGKTLEEIDKLSDTQMEAVFSTPGRRSLQISVRQTFLPSFPTWIKLSNAKARHEENNGSNIL
jgi:hypothetical protein